MMVGLEDVSPEVLHQILEKLPAKTLLNLSECNSYFHAECLGDSLLWKKLCKHDLDVNLHSWDAFSSCHEAYQFIYKARMLKEDGPDWWGKNCVAELLILKWLTLWRKPLFIHYRKLSKFKAKQVWQLEEKELPIETDSGTVNWSECYDAAVQKHGSISRFQSYTLSKCTQSTHFLTRVHLCSSRKVRQNYYNQLYNSVGNKPVIRETLIMESSGFHSFSCSNIRNDFISGKLNRFGKLQLAEYLKFSRAFYEETKNELCSLTDDDIARLVVLTYEKIGDKIYDHLYTKDEFLALAQSYASRMSLVWDWQIENGPFHQTIHRRSSEVKEFGPYSDFIFKGRMEDFQKLRNHFEGIENISIWLTKYSKIAGLLNDSVKAVLYDKNSSNLTPDAEAVKLKMNLYLNSGKDEHLRSLLKTLNVFVTSYLVDCFVQADEFDKKLDDGSVPISVAIGGTRKRERREETDDRLGPSPSHRLKKSSLMQNDLVCLDKGDETLEVPPISFIYHFVGLPTLDDLCPV